MNAMTARPKRAAQKQASTPQPATERRFGRKPPPENETAEERFRRLAQARVVATLQSIRLIGNLATGDYKWTQEQATHILTSLQMGLDELGQKFARNQRQRKLEDMFKIDDLVTHEQR